jgi:hypothetical protein
MASLLTDCPPPSPPPLTHPAIKIFFIYFVRTYPKGYKPPDEEPSEYQTIPLNKIEDFGVHCKQYYALDVQYFKSAMDKVTNQHNACSEQNWALISSCVRDAPQNLCSLKFVRGEQAA